MFLKIAEMLQTKSEFPELASVSLVLIGCGKILFDGMPVFYYESNYRSYCTSDMCVCSK